MRIVLIHGRSQQARNPDELRFFWEGALSRGFINAGLRWPDEAEFVFPFYGERLDRLVEQISSPLMNNLLARGDQSVPGDEFCHEILEEMIRAYPGLDEQVIPLEGSSEPVERGLRNWRGVQAMLRTLDRTPMGSTAISRLTRDVFAYLTNYGVRTQIDAIVAEATNNGKCIVVAHSLGTVVAYNVLSKRPSVGDIALFVTLGSPLGIDAIRKRVESPLAMPPGVKHWFNARDPRDVVALYPLDSVRFNVSPSIENSEFDNFAEDRHGIEGYLANPSVARQINTAICAVDIPTTTA